MNLILASASKYRQELLSRLGLPFQSHAPLIDEEKEKERVKNLLLGPTELAQHLAQAKALSLASAEKVVIGGDQLVAFEGQILGKGHTPEGAIAQLCQMQGKTHELVTAVCVVANGRSHAFVDTTLLTMKELSREQIQSYVANDKPLDCAGSYKIERQGISLFEKIETKDFTAIQGLPLIQLSKVLHTLGYRIP